ncbi:CsgG/HfaB family protein [Candidatus Neomarinimicrobiota bacterium]
MKPSIVVVKSLFLIMMLSPLILQGQKIPIAVLEFEASGISQSDVIALTDRLRNELFNEGAFDVLERGMMEAILIEQDFQLTGCTTDDCLVEIGLLVGAQQMVGGRVSEVDGIITVSTRLIDVETGKILRVSDYDYDGRVRDLLTDGMREIAARLSGVEPDATDKASKPTQALQIQLDDSQVSSEIEIRGALPPRFYIEGKRHKYETEIKPILIAAGDSSTLEMIESGERLSDIAAVIDGAAFLAWIFIDGNVGVPLLVVGIVTKGVSSVKYIRPAIRRYNQNLRRGG